MGFHFDFDRQTLILRVKPNKKTTPAVPKTIHLANGVQRLVKLPETWQWKQVSFSGSGRAGEAVSGREAAPVKGGSSAVKACTTAAEQRMMRRVSVKSRMRREIVFIRYLLG
jgi:hypothetical protein